MKLYLIRHGETDWNKLRRLQGQVDIPLNAFGIHLAEATAPALRDVPFDLAYTSPLTRARQTAEIVLGGREIPIIDEPRLMEVSFGEYEGLCCGKENWNIPDPDFNEFFENPEKYPGVKGGESFEELTGRLDDFLKELYGKAELQDKTILISTHGAALCGLLWLMRGNLPLSKYWGNGVHKNCAVSVAEVKNGEVTILSENVTYYRDEVADW